MGDAFTARSHRIATLDSHHRPDAHDQHTRQTNTLFHTTQRETCQTQPGQTQKKRSTQQDAGTKGTKRRSQEREREKNGSPPTGQAETNSLKRPKTLEGVEPHRALTASNSVVWQEPSPTLRCEAQRCGSDAIPPRGCQLAAMLVPPPRLPSPQGHPQWPCRRGALGPDTLRVYGVQSEEDLPRQC